MRIFQRFFHLASVTVLVVALATSAASGAVVRPKADLTVTVVKASPASLTAGSATTLNVTVKNVGRALASGSSTSIWLSRDAVRNAGDRKLGQKPVLAVRISRTAVASIRVVVPAGTPTGTRYVLACADELRRIAEANERNNCRAARITVTAPPGSGNTTPTPTTPTPTTPTPAPVDPRTVDQDGDGVTEANGDCRPADGSSFPVERQEDRPMP